MMVEVEITNEIFAWLQLVKSVRNNTGWGLKESKDWVDELKVKRKMTIDVKNPQIFEKELANIKGAIVHNRVKNRLQKIIKIGIATREEKVDFYSEELALGLIGDTSGIQFDKVKDYFTKLLMKLDDQNLEKIIEK